MKKALVLGVVLSAVLLLVVGSAHAVTWGVPDKGAHPYVGTLLFQQGGTWYSCTGTLLNANTVVTAGHCTEEGGVVNARTYFMLSEDVLSTRSTGESLEQWLVNDWIPTSAVYPHPQYDDFAAFPATYDVGIVKLARSVQLNTYGQLPALGLLNTLQGQQKHANFTVVGYGMQGYINPFNSDLWVRYKGTVSLIELNSTNNGGMSAKFGNNPGGGNGSGGSCYGDSGGPVFYGNTNTLVAVVSWGNTPCIGVDYQFRLDTSIALNFVSAYLH